MYIITAGHSFIDDICCGI